MDQDEISLEKPKDPAGKTIFVRNLPYSTTDKQLEDTFSEYGPIKRCFVIKDKDKGNACRGFGYVTFVMQDDAAKSLEQTVQLGTRKLQLSIAEKKPRQRDNYKSKKKHDEETKESKEDGEPEITEKLLKGEKNNTKRGDFDQNKRTVVLSNLDSKTTKSKLKIFCSKQGKVEKIEYPVPGRTNDIAYITFKSIKSTVRASQKLNGMKFGDANISCCLLNKEGRHPSSKVLEKAQLIVRNLSFKCKEDDLHSAFQKFGNILKVELPIKENSKGKKKFLGFAFVQFSCKENAQEAMKHLNKTSLLDRPMVIDWAVPKNQYLKATGSKELDDVKESEKYESGEIEKKDKVEKNGKLDDEDPDDDADSGDDDGSSEEMNDNENDDEEQSEDEDADSISDNDDMQTEVSQEDEEERQAQLKKHSKDAKEGKTIFIRNLPFESSEEEVIECFSKYGEIDYCKMVVDIETGHSRGSAFVKYKEIDSADLAVTQAEENSSLNGITIDGRRLTVMKAVTKGKVKEIEKKKKEEKKDPKDKRNLFLLHEGVIFPNSEAAKELSESDLKKREKAWTEKKAKLKNQNYFISKTRLCIRNLPLNVGEKDLKASFLKALGNPNVKISKTLIMRSKERRDQSGKPRSLGFAFMELNSHENALAVLRATNNNPDIFGASRRPIVEFSVENQLALNVQKKRLEKQQKNKSQKDTDAETTGSVESKKGGRTLSTGKGKGRKGGEKKEGDMKDSMCESSVSDGKENSGATGNIGGRKKSGRRNKKKSAKDKEDKTVNVNNNRTSDKHEALSISEVKKPMERAQSKPNRSASNVGQKNRKRTLDSKAAPSSEPKTKKPKKKAVVDNEEKQFNLLVNKYKEKLFGNVSATKKVGEKRWFE